MSRTSLRIAFLHLAPLPGQIAHSRRLIETAVTTAAQAGATWILTPELAVCGYTFADQIGTDWIEPQPDTWMTHLFRLAAQWRLTLFLSYPERDRQTKHLYNSLFVITPEGTLTGAHRKFNALRVGSEAWATPGTENVTVAAPPLLRMSFSAPTASMPSRRVASGRVWASNRLLRLST